MKQVQNYKGGQRVAINKMAEAFSKGEYIQQGICDALHYAFDETRPKNEPSDIPTLPIVPETLRLDFWKQRVKNATVTSEIQVSRLFLPNGAHPTYLKIIETVTPLSSEEISRL